MAIHTSILAWRIPLTEEPGGLQSTGSQSNTTEATEHIYLFGFTGSSLRHVGSSSLTGDQSQASCSGSS